MEEIHQHIRAAYERAGQHEAKARQSPENRDESQNAANSFAEAADLSDEVTRSDTATEAERLMSPAFSSYYRSQQQKSLMNLHYQERSVEAALQYAATAEHFLQDAINKASDVVHSPALLPAQSAHVQKMINNWRFQMLGQMAKPSSIIARGKWDDGRFLEALDHYRLAARKEKLAIEYLHSHELDPVNERVTTGNFIAIMANISQALCSLALTRARENTTTKQASTLIPEELSMEVLRHTYEAYEIGQQAVRVNPEWDQYRLARSQCKTNIEQFLRDNKTQWLHILSNFENQPDFLQMMRGVDLSLFRKIESERYMVKNRAAQLWGIGSFWLLALLLIFGVVLVMARMLGFWTTLISLVGVEVIFLFVGAFILRSSGELSEMNFLVLISMATKFQLKSIANILKAKSSSNEDNEAD